VKEGEFVVRNRLGLHARAAAVFVKKANEFKSDVFLEREGKAVNGKSIMGVLLLACPFGSRLLLRVEGEDEELAFSELGRLIDNGFDEEE
jgi:phosphocarrier protein